MAMGMEQCAVGTFKLGLLKTSGSSLVIVKIIKDKVVHMLKQHSKQWVPRLRSI